MMAHRSRSLSRLPILLLIVLPIFFKDSEGSDFIVKERRNCQDPCDVGGDENAVKLREQRNGNRERIKDRNNLEEHDGAVVSSNDRVKPEPNKPEPDEIENIGKRLRRFMRHDRELYKVLMNNTYRVHESQIFNIDLTEPQCVLRHEYAAVMRSEEIDQLDFSARFKLRFYVNHNDEFRFYICFPCRVCRPKIREIFPCQRKSNAVCGAVVKCDFDMVFDPVLNLCVPPWPLLVEPTTSGATSITILPSITRKDSHAPPPGRHGSGQGRSIDKAGVPSTSPSLSSEQPVSTEIITIAVGVVTLNVLVLGVIITLKRIRWRNRVEGKSRKSPTFHKSINNVPSTPVGCNPPSTPLPSISHQVDNTTSFAAADESILRVEINREMGAQSHNSANHEVRAKECNLNVYREPGYDKGAQTVLIPQDEELDSPPSIQVLRGKNPFWLVMIGQFGPEGGTLSCEDSDVVLEIPPGAISANRQDQLITARVSLCPDSLGPKLKNPDFLWLTPLVELESPGLKGFNKNVRLRLPHRARMQSGWTFDVHFTDPNEHVYLTSATNYDPEIATALLGVEPKWFCVQKKWQPGKTTSGDVRGVTFTVDEKYINVCTSHFSDYVCSGCNANHPLNLEAVVYWNHLKVADHEQMDLNVYIIDMIKDTRKANVEQNERSGRRAGSQSGTTGYFPLALEYTTGEASSLVICVDEECMGPDWKWKLRTYNKNLPAERVMSVESVIRGCCSSLLSAREIFAFSPRMLDKNEQVSVFEAMVCIKQPNQPIRALPIPVSVALAKDSRMSLPVNNNNNVSPKGTIVTTDHIEFVAERIPAHKWRPLYRKLMGKGADNGIDVIQTRDPSDLLEQKRSALVGWRKSKGCLATVEKLATALEDVQLQDLAEGVQSFCPAEAPHERGPALQETLILYEETDL